MIRSYSYRSQWWILHNADGACEASGIHGQMIHINRAAEMVVVKCRRTRWPARASHTR